MRRYFFILTTVFILSLLQSSFMAELFGRQANPNLILCMAFALLFIDQFDLSMFSAMFGGLFLDLSGYTLIGINTISAVFLVLIVYLVRRYFFRNFYMQLFLIFLAYIVYTLFVSEKGFVLSYDILIGGLINIVTFLLSYLAAQYTFVKDRKSEYKVS